MVSSTSQGDILIWDSMSPAEDKAVMEKFAAESNKIANRWFFGGASLAEKDAAVSFLVELGAVQITIQPGNQQTVSQEHVSILFRDGEDFKTFQECSKDAMLSDRNAVTPSSVLIDQGAEKTSEATMYYDDVVDDEDNKTFVWMTEPDDEDDDDDDNQIPDPAPVVEERSTTQPREEHPCPDCHTVLPSLWELDLHKLNCFRQTITPQKHIYNCDQCSNSFTRQVCAVSHLRKVHNMSPSQAFEKLADLKSTERQKRRREPRITNNKDLTQDKKTDISDPTMTSDISKGTVEGKRHPGNEHGAKQEQYSGTELRIEKRSLQDLDEDVSHRTKHLFVKLPSLAKKGKKILESETVDTSILTSNRLINDPHGNDNVSNEKRAELIRTSDEHQKVNSNTEDDTCIPSSIRELEPLDIKEGETNTSETIPADEMMGISERADIDAEKFNSVDFREHEDNVITNQKPKKCKFCDLQFKTRYQRNQHVLKNHTEDVPEYKCSTCNRSFLEKRAFSVHLKTHMNINEREKYSCTICEKSFLGKYDYRRHMKSHDEKPDAFKCETCGKVTTSKRNLERHQNTKHIKKVLYTCEVCGKNFYTTSCIKQHLETHTKERSWECDECGFAFFRKSQLTAHQQRVHSNRQCVCTICGAAFKTKGTLKGHYRNLHSDVYDFSCDVCGKKVKSSSQLNSHVKIHFKDPKYKRNEKKNASLIRQ